MSDIPSAPADHPSSHPNRPLFSELGAATPHEEASPIIFPSSPLPQSPHDPSSRPSPLASSPATPHVSPPPPPSQLLPAPPTASLHSPAAEQHTEITAEVETGSASLGKRRANQGTDRPASQKKKKPTLAPAPTPHQTR